MTPKIFEAIKGDFLHENQIRIQNGTDANTITMLLWGGLVSAADMESFLHEHDIPYSKNGKMVTINFLDGSTAEGERYDNGRGGAFAF